jgi:protein involved in polysaccharide export with SLBB domain
MRTIRDFRLVPIAALSLALAGCGGRPLPHIDLLGVRDDPPPAAVRDGSRDFRDIPYASWSDYEPPYRFYPGDELEVSLPTAPELTKTATVQPDGRISLPLIGAMMAADRTIPELQASLADAYATQLLRPTVEVSPKAAPLKVFVGGEVRNPGIFDMTGDGDALRAVIQAGDFLNSASRTDVLVIRRGPDGRGMIRRVNLQKGLKSGVADLVPLRRFDIVYVPKSGIADANLLVQQYFRDLSPIQFGFNYALGPTTR